MVNETHRKKQFPQVLNGLTTSRVHVLSSLLERFGRVKRSLKNFSTWKRQAQDNTQLPKGSYKRIIKATTVLFPEKENKSIVSYRD